MTWKNIILHIAFIAMLLPASAQQLKSDYRSFIPQNGIKLYDYIYIDSTEIFNIHYGEYLFHIRKDSSESFYNFQLPDSSLWKTALNLENRNKPLAGVTYFQALNYCRWRTEVVNKHLKKYYKLKPEFKGYKVTVYFRLPTEDEWEYAAKAGRGFNELSEIWNEGKLAAVPDSSVLNDKLDLCMEEYHLEVSRDTVFRIPFDVKENFYNKKTGFLNCIELAGLENGVSFPANPMGVFNMLGGVSEMIIEMGVCKGGNYKESINEISVKRKIKYTGPTEWLGFRCVCEVKIEKQ